MKKWIFKLVFLLAALSLFSQSPWHHEDPGIQSFYTDVHFSDPHHGWISGIVGLIMHTSNGGESWEELIAPSVNGTYNIFFINNQEGWACGYSGRMIHTTDGGQTWEFQTSGSDTFITDVYFINQDTGWTSGGDNGTFPSNIKYREILHTTDGGNTWTKQVAENYEAPLSCIHFTDENHGYASGNAGILLRTGDGGNTWSEVTVNTTYEFNSVFFINPDTGWLVGQDLALPHVAGIYMTTDAGDTWTLQTFGTDETLSDVHFTDDLHGWAVGGKNDVAVILHTDDGGNTWNYQDATVDSYLAAVHFAGDGAGWAVGYETLITTYDPPPYDKERPPPSIHLYPNPASDQLIIEPNGLNGDFESVMIVNSLGQVVYNSEGAVAAGSSGYSVSVGGLKKGVYHVIVQENGRRSTETLFISR